VTADVVVVIIGAIKSLISRSRQEWSTAFSKRHVLRGIREKVVIRTIALQRRQRPLSQRPAHRA
jgi:hypothetical protein